MKHQDNWSSYIDKTTNDNTRREILSWLQSCTDEELKDSLDRGWDLPPAPMPVSIAKELDKQLRQQGLPVDRPARVRYIRILRRAAVAACIALLAGSLFHWQQLRPHQQSVTPSPGREIANTSMHVRKLTLPDGSHIWITPGSILTVPEDYNITSRNVTLAGEGYFEVAPMTIPFHVKAGGLETTVLGTHFNIEAYPGENMTGVALSSGSVAVKVWHDSSLVLTPGHKLTYQPSSHHFTTRRFVPEKETDWKQGALVLDDVPLEAAFNRLEKRFCKKIVLTSNAGHRTHFTATYHAESLTDILQNMSFIYGFKYHETRDSVIIH
ncbi:DUF4974 domain-containing protein [Chitinophaga sp. G-6-1-13]|uniref:DUF4974 domain-containing protein n=1 Tax=Chitinophaga fulva TaxID=2728842 RepID=A0A848GLT7_9BACT|nr:FecR domain-containing protein [Chitinophaga fulva]NML36918.1 DUF4974 domain-containing protein [Chitinophaga fulva]